MKLPPRYLWPLALGLFFAGCGGLIPPPQADPTHYYILSGPAPVSSDTLTAGHLRLGLKSVELAAYLKSPGPHRPPGRERTRSPGLRPLG